jgi:hypothetical protein
MPDYLEDFDGAPLPDELQPGGPVYEAVLAAMPGCLEDTGLGTGGGGRTSHQARLYVAADVVARLGPVLAPWLPSLHPIRIGDPDCTPAPDDVAVYCGEVRDDGVLRGVSGFCVRCTWPPEHVGDHVAGDGKLVTAVWNNETAQILLQAAPDV